MRSFLSYIKVWHINHRITLGYSLTLPYIILGDCLKLCHVVYHHFSVWGVLKVFKDSNETWGLYAFEPVSHQNITDVHYHMKLEQFLNPQITVISEFMFCTEWKKIVILFIWRIHCDKQSDENNHVKFNLT